MSRLVVLPALLVLLALAGCGAAPPAAVDLSGTLDVRVPERAAVGTPLVVDIVRPDAPDGTPATLVAVGSYGTALYRAEFATGVARMTLPAADTTRSGLLSLIARSGAAQGSAVVDLEPGSAVEPVTPLVGPRSIVADGDHWSMAVAIPFDRFGNPVASGTPVDFGVAHPGQPLATTPRLVQHGVAWLRFYSALRAGRTTVVAGVGEARGPESTIMEVPGWPVSYGITATPTTAPADGRQLITLRTEPIRDRWGNQMLDGTLVTFAVEAPDAAPRLIPAYTIDGVAEAQLQAPTTPGVLLVRGTMYGLRSAPLRITFTEGPAVNAFRVAATVDPDDGNVRLATSTLLGALGQFVPDGTLVRFTLRGADGDEREVTAEAEHGRAAATVRLADLRSRTYAVEVGVGSARAETTFVVP